MLKLRTDTKYVTPDGKLTQAGVEAFQGLIDANTAGIAANAADIAALEAIAITSAPGAAPRYACRAWVNFNGTGTVAVRASGNVASITDNGVGDYTINFTTAMPDADYAVVGFNTVATDGTKGSVGLAGGYNTAATLKTTTQVRIRTGPANALSFADFEQVNVAIFR